MVSYDFPCMIFQAVLVPPGNLEMQVTEPGNLEEGIPSRWFPDTETFRKSSLNCGETGSSGFYALKLQEI